MNSWLHIQAIYVLWLREMKRYLRARSRIIGSLGMPFFFLVFLGTGFKNFQSPHLPVRVDYLNFVAPGIMAIVLQLGSMFGGMSILWDRQFGFLKEIMVTPVSRISIVFGRTLGGISTAVIQSLLFFGVSLFAGLKLPGFPGFIHCGLFMILIACAFVNMGLVIASFMRDMQGFSIIMNFVMVPIFLLSGALFPLQELPQWLQSLCYVNPLFYGVDGLRFSLIGISVVPIILDYIMLIGWCSAMMLTGAFLFNRLDID